MESKKITKHIVILITCCCAIALFLAMTNPKRLPPVLLIIPFVLLFLIIFLGVLAVGRVISGRQSLVRASERRSRVPTFVVSALPVLLLVLQSVGQLTSKDVMIVLTIFSLAYLYIARFATVRTLVR